MYKEDKISIYDENKRLVNQIYIENVYCVIRVEVLDAIKQINRYNKKDYTFYNDNKETICLRVNREMYFKIENGFTSALNTATNLICKTCTKISDKLDEMLGLEIVKEYKINRKRQGQ